MTYKRLATARLKSSCIAPAILIVCALGSPQVIPAALAATPTDALSNIPNAQQGKVTPPARPTILTVVEPGLPEEKKLGLEHGHKHKGYDENKFKGKGPGFSRE